MSAPAGPPQPSSGDPQPASGGSQPSSGDPQPYPAGPPQPYQPGPAQPYQPGPAQPYQPGPGQPDPTGSPQPYPGGPQQPYQAGPPQPFPSAPPAQPYYPPEPAAPVSPLPTEPSEYQQLFRGPRRRWWRPLISLLLAAGFWLIQVVLLTVAFMIYSTLIGRSVEETLTSLTGGDLGPDAFLFNNLILIALIPSVLLANRIAHGLKVGYTTSVAGRVRWRWLARCLITVAPLWVIYLGLGQVFFPAASPRPEQWVAMLILVLLTTPLQCAAEEYGFRAWILQNVGSWIRHPVVAIVIATVLSSAVFALAHGSLDFFVLADIGLFAVAAVILTWRTGGLEAAIAIHTVNNVLIFVTIMIFGGWEDALVGPETTGSPISLIMSAVVDAIAVALILWQAKVAKIDRLYRPAPPNSPVAQVAPAQPGYSYPGQQYGQPGQPG